MSHPIFAFMFYARMLAIALYFNSLDGGSFQELLTSPAAFVGFMVLKLCAWSSAFTEREALSYIC